MRSIHSTLQGRITWLAGLCLLGIAATLIGLSLYQARQAIDALQRITGAVNLISDMNLQIASAAEEQSSVAEEIGRNIGAIRDVTQALSDQAERSARLSQQLNHSAEQQHRLMQQFKACGSPGSAASPGRCAAAAPAARPAPAPAVRCAGAAARAPAPGPAGARCPGAGRG